MELKEKQLAILLILLDVNVRKESNLINKSEYLNIYKILLKEKESMKNQPKLEMRQIMTQIR
jgi:hypothetical protein